MGGEFTWEKSKGSDNWVRERLDRAFADMLWWRKFFLCKLTLSHVIKYDHDPIVLEPVNVNVSRKQFRFRFENMWLNERSFKEEVSKFWCNIPKCTFFQSYFLCLLLWQDGEGHFFINFGIK